MPFLFQVETASASSAYLSRQFDREQPTRLAITDEFAVL